MKNTILRKIVCILLGSCFLVPTVGFTEVKGDTGKSYIYCWREGESWDWSYDNDSGENWIVTNEGIPPSKPASNGYYTKQDGNKDGDYAIWDFTVYQSGYYRFLIRAWCNDEGSQKVALYWNDHLVDERIFYSSRYNNWYWFDFPETGFFSLSSGKGTLRIESKEPGLMEIDNIVVTDDPTLNPPWYDLGKEGYTNHTIGQPSAIQPGATIKPINTTYIKSKTETLSKTIDDAPKEFGIAKGRDFGTPGERWAADNIKYWIGNDTGLFTYKERIIAYPDQYIDDKLVITSKHLSVNGDPVECFISQNWTQPFTHNYSYTDLPVKQRFSGMHTLNETYDQAFEEFWEDKKDEIMAETVEVQPQGRSEENGTFENICNVTITYFEDYYDFSFDELDPDDSSTFPSFFNGEYLCYGNCVLIEEDPWNNPDSLSEPGVFGHTTYFVKYHMLTLFFHIFDEVKALILYDFNDHTHNMVKSGTFYKIIGGYGFSLPLIFINGTKGQEIDTNPDDYTVDFWLNQVHNTSVKSYNVIGTIYGEDLSKTIIVSSLYDCWWNQGAADSAIGMAIVLGIAKYFRENTIIPRYTLKFIAFGGEEHGYLGAKSYAYRHENEDILAVIDLNQLGFDDPLEQPLKFIVTVNSDELNSTVSMITERSNYDNTGTPLRVQRAWWGAPSNDRIFARRGPNACKTMCFLKDTGWTQHHRDGRKNGAGEPHTEGDVFEYYNDTYVAIVAEMILNVTKYFTAQAAETLLTQKWCFVSAPFNDPVYKNTDLSVKYGGNWYRWADAASIGLISDYIFGWNRNSQTYYFTDKLMPGEGYWMYSYEPCTLVMNGTLHDHDPLSVLKENWNIVGLPGWVSVNKTDLYVEYNGNSYSWADAVGMGLISDYIFAWDRASQTYGFSDTLDPGQGYWVYAYQPCTLLYDASASDGSDGGSDGDNPQPDDDGGDEQLWETYLMITETGGNNTRVYFGENTGAHDGPPWDKYDAPLPPAPPTPYIQAWFDDNLSTPYHTLFRDYRYGRGKYKEWNLSVHWVPGDQSNTTVNISWNPETLGKTEYERITLVDNGIRVADMLRDSYYRYTADANVIKEFQIICQS